jgi:hypothetical protein
MLVLGRIGRGAHLPLGTFLCFGGIVTLVWGADLVAAYFGLMGLP